MGNNWTGVKRIFHTFALLGICLGEFFVYLRVSKIGINQEAALLDMIEGTASLPFQYRVLIPGIINILVALFPENMFSGLNISALDLPIAQLAGSDGAGKSAAWFALILMFVSLCGAVLLFQRLMVRLEYSPKAICSLSLLYPISLMAFFSYAYVYDFPSLFLFSWALYSLAPTKDNKPKLFRDWVLYFSLFTLATFNKETSIILLIPYMLVYYPRLERKKFIQFGVLQLLIYGTIKLFLFLNFSQNPGTVAVSYWWVYKQFPVLIVLTILLFSLIFLPIARGWNHKPLFLRQALMMIVPLVLLFFLFGFPFEFRVFYEVYPVVFLLLIPQKVSEISRHTFK